MRVIYNGIDLGVLETYAFDVEPVFDDSGVDYLYSRVSLLVRAIVNGQAQVVDSLSTSAPGGGVLVDPISTGTPGPPISYNFAEPETRELRNSPPPDRGNPGKSVPGNGLPTGVGVAAARVSRLRRVVRVANRPLLTHQTVRSRLALPRGKLYVFSGIGAEAGNLDANGDGVPGTGAPPGVGSPGSAAAEVTIETPEKGMVCDCKNGPSPKLLGVHAAYGDANTLMVDWSVEAYIIESDLNGIAPAGVMLSNRFIHTQMVDEAGWTTNVCAGTAIFRTDRVYSLPESPDARRPLLFMPIPLGFVRENIQVQGRDDVTGVVYSYRDRQVPVNFPAGPYARAASISALHRQAITSDMDVLEGALTAYERGLNLSWMRKAATEGTRVRPNVIMPGEKGSAISPVPKLPGGKP